MPRSLATWLTGWPSTVTSRTASALNSFVNARRLPAISHLRSDHTELVRVSARPGEDQSSPAALGLPFACWTLDRLVAYLSGQGIAMRRSRISEIFIREGLKWRHDETWFGERVDPDFAKKRGSSSSSTQRRRPAA